MRQMKIVFTLALIVGTTSTARMQAPAQVGAAASVTHVAIVVRDIDATAREYVRVMGFPAPKVTSFFLDVPDGQKAQAKVNAIRAGMERKGGQWTLGPKEGV